MQALTAFVLAGGGSFGAIQVGMLRALVAHGIRPDLLVGSSVGAINGAYFAAHPDAAGVDHLGALWCGLHRSAVFPLAWRGMLGLAGPRGAAVDPAGLRSLVQAHLPYERLEQSPLPMHVVTTDLLSGATVTLSQGPAVDAVMASCAIPAIFPPVNVGGKYLIDGAVASNTPVSVAIELGATRIIVLPTGYACAIEVPPRSAIGVALHALTLLISRQLVYELRQYGAQADIVTVPPLCPLDASPYDFSHAAQLIDRASAQTTHWLEHDGMTRHRGPGALEVHRH